MESLDTYNHLTPKIEDQPIAGYSMFIKQEKYDEDNDLERNHSLNDITKIKQEDLSDCYTSITDPLDNIVKVEVNKDVQDELENNFIRASNMEYFTSKTDGSETMKKDVKQEDLSDCYTSVIDPLDNIVKVEADKDIKNELENNFVRSSNMECITSKTDGSEIMQKDPLDMLTSKSTINESNTSVVRKRPRTTGKQYICDVCEKEFSRSSALILHKRIHTGEKPFVCDVCYKAFTQSYHLVLHKRTHTGNKPAVKKSIHTGDKPEVQKLPHTTEKTFDCDMCDRSFSQSSHLKRHKRVHTGEKPYVCQVCNKAFANSSHFTLHKRIHTGEKPYVCDVCDLSFANSSNLGVHKRTHTGERPYVCDVCFKAFNLLFNLMTHKRTHTGEKPYVCDVCYKASSTSSSLKKHKRTHTGERPYVCDICSKSYTESRNLKLHKRIHT